MSLHAPTAFRVLLAVGLTLGAMAYTWDTFLVRWMMDGYLNWRMLALFLPSLMLTIYLTRDLAPRLTSDRVRRWLFPMVLVAWVLEHVVLVLFNVSSLSPQLALIGLLSVSTFWIPWTAWLDYGPMPRRATFPLLGLLLLLGPAFPLLFSVQGLTGESIVHFSWRWADGSNRTVAQDFPGERIAHGTADLTRTTPNDFPQYLGPQRTAVLASPRLARDWSAQPPRQVWRRPVGEGWSGFAIVGDYAVTQEQRGPHECVTCYRLADGERVWMHADEVRYESRLGGDGPRATPTVAGGRVYTVGALGLLNCLDGATGNRLWFVNIQEDAGGEVLRHGVCGSPLVVDNLVIVCPTGKEGVTLAAYDRHTGTRVWLAGEPEMVASYASPLLAEYQGVRQVVIHHSGGVAGHEPATGKLLWSFPWTNGEYINCSMPILDAGKPGQVFAATGYQSGSTLYRVERSPDGTWSEPEQLWKVRQMKVKFTTAVQYQGHVYGLDDGYLACIDLTRGKSCWKDRTFRYKHGQLLLVGDLLLIQAEEGDLFLVEPNPEELREVARMPALGNKTWNNPALAGRFLLVRNDKEAVCFELPLAERP